MYIAHFYPTSNRYIDFEKKSHSTARMHKASLRCVVNAKVFFLGGGGTISTLVCIVYLVEDARESVCQCVILSSAVLRTAQG